MLTEQNKKNVWDDKNQSYDGTRFIKKNLLIMHAASVVRE